MSQPGRFVFYLLIAAGAILLGWVAPGAKQALAQQPTGSIPTVTGTPEGPYVRVDPSIPQIRVWAGPSSLGEYPAIRILLANETAPALARAEDKPQWIQIYYPGVPGSVGWVFANYVSISPGAVLKTIEVPATPTPLSTPTIDPTLVAHQEWINLLANAIKFSSRVDRAVIEVGTKRSESEHVYYVRDNGAGFTSSMWTSCSVSSSACTAKMSSKGRELD